MQFGNIDTKVDTYNEILSYHIILWTAWQLIAILIIDFVYMF